MNYVLIKFIVPAILVVGALAFLLRFFYVNYFSHVIDNIRENRAKTKQYKQDLKKP